MITPLREKRFFAEMSMYELGRITGLTPPRISLIERGYKAPREDEIQKIAKALMCDASEIFPTKDEIKPVASMAEKKS